MNKLIEQLNSIYQLIFSRTNKLRFNSQDAQHVCSVCMHGSILEGAAACITLLKNSEWNAVPPMLRNLLEEYVDLVNVAKESTYLKRMWSTFLKEKSRVLKRAVESGGTNPYLEALSNTDGVPEHYKKVVTELSALRKEGFGELRIKDKFERAGLLEKYESVYALLCQHSHNNLNILERRHLEEKDKKLRVSYFQPWGNNEMIPYIDTIAAVLVGSIKELGSVLEITNELGIEEIEAELANLRGLYYVAT